MCMIIVFMWYMSFSKGKFKNKLNTIRVSLILVTNFYFVNTLLKICLIL